MKKLEARIRVHGNTELSSLFEVAVAELWLDRGAYNPTEAFCILYLNKKQKGRIVEAEYSGGPTDFKEKTQYDKAPLVSIPRSLVDAAWLPLEDAQSPWHFKPVSDEDLNFIRRNCYRLK